MFTTQAWEPEFDHQNPCKRVEQSTVVYTWNSNTRKTEKKRSLWHTGQKVKNTCWVPRQWETMFQRRCMMFLRMKRDAVLWSPQVNAYMCTHTHLSVHEHAHKWTHTQTQAHIFFKVFFHFESKQQQFKMYWNHKNVSEDTSIGNERLEKNPK